MEVVADLVVGHGTLGGHAVYFAGVPAESRVQPVKHAVPGHEALSGAALFRRTAEKFHRPRQVVFLQVLLNAQRRGQCAHTQKIVAAAVSGAALGDGALSGTAGLLAQTGQSVKFSQKPDNRAAAAVGARECRLNARKPALYLKAQLFQLFTVELSGESLMIARLWVVP